jgi:hypothetical protein
MKKIINLQQQHEQQSLLMNGLIDCISHSEEELLVRKV